ncbi:MAG TPA: type I polyketide synthase [Blastocatellia bacterium]|nr:type I polyketide synthase [Blastocatellia bacterium]
MMIMTPEIDDSAIAIVGMAGRFPGANCIDELWDLLKNGREALSPISIEDLVTAGIDRARLEDPAWVKYGMRFEKADYFDAEFFGYNPRQAVNIDPQQRVFLECAWEALENAGYRPGSSEESVGVFAGSGFSSHLLESLARNSEKGSSTSFLEHVLDNDKDFLTTRVAYKLGLTGPCISVQTACSTSLVAVHTACQSLLTGECDLALAGGVSLSMRNTGYRYEEHSILSPDAHCRAFDAEANGTVPGAGAAVVVLCRLTEALEKGYQVHAIIKASVVNNDGSQKVSFTAPGLSSQRELLARGLALAALHPSEIGYIEAHGTGTVLGDSIELTALKDVYGSSSRPCALGSIKPNIGHLDAAAGVAGLIKAVLCLKKRALVPSLGCVKPNPILREPGCPLYVNTTFQPWESDDDRPRRAAVSSFGMGGTNAHVILEEAPEGRTNPNGERVQILPLSARTPTALGQAADNLAQFIEQNPGANLADMAYTLQIGRTSFAHRRFVVGGSSSELAARLRNQKADGSKALDGRPVIFLFPSEGLPEPGMARHLYRTENYFREQLDQCSDRIDSDLGFEIRRFLCDGEVAGDSQASPAVYTQAALFALEYCLARLWLSWGLTPSAMFGHGPGEYVAAAVAEAISIEDAVKLVVERAKLIGRLPEGAPLGTDLSEEHLAAFRKSLSLIKTAEPKLSYLSGLTGTYLSGQQVKEPAYWENQMLNPDRFTQVWATLRDWPGAVFLEVGPGPVLSNLARQHLGTAEGYVFLPGMPDAVDREDLLGILGRLWSEGATVDWNRSYQNQARRRVELPTYPFERRRYAHDTATETRSVAPNGAAAGPALPPDLSPNLLNENSFYMPSWKGSAPLVDWKMSDSALDGLWVVFEDEAGLGPHLTEELRNAGGEVISVVAASRYRKVRPDKFQINPDDRADYSRLISGLKQREPNTLRLAHCWGPTTKKEIDDSREAEASGYRSLLFLAQALSEMDARAKSTLLAVTTQLFDVAGEGATNSAEGAIPAICMVASQEMTNLRCGVVDLPIGREHWKQAAGAVLAELSMSLPEPVVAYRGRHRFVRAYEPVRLSWEMPQIRKLREKGVYLITGGLGKIGLSLGQELARQYQARLVLMTRSSFAERSEWDGLLTQSSRDESMIGRIEAIRKMEDAGAEVIVAGADVSNPEDVRRILSEAQHRFGPLNGVFHLAADLRHQSVSRPIAELTPTDIATQARPKIDGFKVLNRELRDQELDFGVIFSSNASILGGVGFGAYASANALVDRVLPADNGTARFQWLVMNWDGWLTATGPGDWEGKRTGETNPFVLSEEEGLEALWRIIGLSTVSQVVISKGNLGERLERWVRRPPQVIRKRSAESQEQAGEGGFGVRVGGGARTDLEKNIIEIWEELLGVEGIGVEDNFLDLGGDSLTAVRIIGRVRELIGISVASNFFLDLDCTVEELAKEIVTTLTASHDPKVLQRYLEQVSLE